MLRLLAHKQALKSVKELAKDVKYTKSMGTGWKPPLRYRRMSAGKQQQLRDMLHIVCEGRHLPPPIPSFADMKLPKALVSFLESKGIKKPTPIQVPAAAHT